MKTKTFKINSLFLAVVFSVLMTSCTKTFYQVYDVQSTNLSEKDNSLVYENGDLRVMYNLWSNDGSMGFIAQNLTDKDLFIDMTQTFFIFNGAANDYFRNREFTATTTLEASLGYSVSQSYLDVTGYWPNRYVVPTGEAASAKVTKGFSQAVTTKEAEYICVPANSYKVIDIYKIGPNLVRTCDRKRDFPYATQNVGSYTELTTPMKFKNRISYSFTKDGENLKHIENDFYVTSISNYSKKAAVGKEKKNVGCYTTIQKKIEYFKIGGPNKFYKVYTDKFYE